MNELLLAAADFAALERELLGGETEKCAILYANPVIRSDRAVRLLVREIQHPASDDYSRKGPLEAELTPDFVARVTKRARREKSALVFVHSHPGEHAPRFSLTDSTGEEHLKAFLNHRHPGLSHAAMVISLGGVRARLIGTDDELRVISIGEKRKVLFNAVETEESTLELHDRQVRAFGAYGQKQLQRLRIAIVGLGGTGSLVAQQLAHLGIGKFILVDPDVIETTNLNRVANADASNLGQAKVEVAAAYISEVAKGADVTCVQGDVIQRDIVRKLLEADVIFGCTDSHGSRAVLQQVSYQYLIPYIDMGVTIMVKDGSISHIYGRVQLLAPGLACFACDGLLNANEVRHDMMTPFEREADPYIQGHREPAPSVISLNGTMASLSVTMLLAMVTDVPIAARHLLYNALSSSLRPVRAQPNADCYVCSLKGAFARGDSWPLFAREN